MIPVEALNWRSAVSITWHPVHQILFSVLIVDSQEV